MEHKKAISFFTCYYDGDLSQTDKDWLEAHLADCHACRAEWEQYRDTTSEVSGLIQMPPPPDVVKSVERKIYKRSRGRFFGRDRGNSIQFALVSFILVLLFMLAYLMLTAVNEIVLLDSGSPQGEKQHQVQPAES